MSNIASKRQSSKVIIALTLLVPMLGIAALMIAAGSGQVAEPPTEAKIHKVLVSPVVSQGQYLQQKLAYGRLEANSLTQLGFELSGQVTQLTVDEGNRVAKGQILAKLDVARLEAQMSELNAALSSAQADLNLAQLSKQRVTELVAKKLESSQRLDEVVQMAAVAKARVEEIQARQRSVQVELDKSVLIAPSDAIVISRPIDSGTVISGGQTVLVLQQLNQFDARIALPSEQAFSLQSGQQVNLLINQQVYVATVKSIAGQRKLDTRTVDVLFSVLQGNSDDFVPGDLVAFIYQENIQETGVWVPKQALTSGIRGLWTLFVVPDVGQQVITSKSVEVLYSQSDRAFIRGALKDTDWYVVSGTQRLVPQQKVEATDAQQSVADLGVR